MTLPATAPAPLHAGAAVPRFERSALPAGALLRLARAGLAEAAAAPTAVAPTMPTKARRDSATGGGPGVEGSLGMLLRSWSPQVGTRRD